MSRGFFGHMGSEKIMPDLAWGSGGQATRLKELEGGHFKDLGFDPKSKRNH